jgi:hypothetical protein
MINNCRILVFLFILSIFFPAHSRGQELPARSVVFPDTTCELYSALLMLEQQTGYRFSFNSDLIPSHRLCKLSGSEKLLEEALDELISDPTVIYKVIGNQVVLFRPDYESLAGDSLPEKMVAYIFIGGRIIDNSSRKPVPYANIGLTGRNAGTISNNDGQFLLKINTDDLSDTVAVSFLGYKTFMAPVTRLIGEENVVYLQQDYIPIQEVIIRKTEPVYLIISALNRINKNYPVVPTRQTAFYRETIQKNNRYVMVSEAILNIFKPAYLPVDEQEQVKIILGRKNADISKEDTVTLKMKAGLNTSLVLDIIKSQPDFLNKETMDRFRYSMSDIVFINDDYTYAIDFVQRDLTEPPHYQGRIYIDMKTLAITGAEFELIPERIDEAAALLVVKKPRGLNVKPVSASYQVNYLENNGRYYLNLIRTSNAFRIRKDGRLFGNTFMAVSELAVTSTDTLDVQKFRRKEIARTDDIFMDLVGGYEQSFWGEYNYIVPDEPLEQALQRISKMIRKD